jgi:isopentenyldiphosphate isomerase
MSETGAMDYVTVVDEGDRPIGAVRKAELPAMSGVHFRTAHVFVRSESGELLLQQLAPGRERNAHRWGSSVAGYVRAGENYEDAARRRLAEELGLHLALSTVGTTVMPDQGGFKHVRLFSATTTSFAPTIAEPDHIASLRWASAEEIDWSLRTDPDGFTATFRWLYETFRGSQLV